MIGLQDWLIFSGCDTLKRLWWTINLKVSEMGWEVKKILRGQSKVCLWVFNLKTGKFLPGGTQEQICHTNFGTMPPLWPSSGGFDHTPSESDGFAPQIPYI